MTATTRELQTRFAAHIQPSYATPPLAFVRGEGTLLYDAEGVPYLDFLSGLGVTSLGHAHPAVTAAVAAQAATLTHTSNLFITEPAVALAERLGQLLGWHDARTFLCNSGAEANEAAIKLARRFGLGRRSGKIRVVALEGSFHGRTLATLEATGQPAKHSLFAPLAGFVDHVHYDDPDALAAAVGPQTCAVLLEVIQGEGGVRPVPPAVIEAARAACDRHSALLIIDEVQTGIARTGSWFAFETTGVEPDVITVAKALANGLPIGACVAHGLAATAFQPGEHASTFGGNPVTCAAALAVLDTIQEQDLVAGAAAKGARLAAALGDIDAPGAVGVRGAGLLLALELEGRIAGAVEQAARERRLLVNAVTPDAIRLAPPLTVSDAEVDLAVAILHDALTVVAQQVAA